THEEDGDEDGDERGAHGDDREADFARAHHGGVEGFNSLFQMPNDVFDDDDGVVDDEAGRDGERHEGEIVDAVAAEVHDAESADEGERHGDAGDESGRVVTKEDEDDEDNENNGDDESDLDVVNGGTDRGGAVDDDAEVDGRVDRSLELRELGADAI